MKVSRNPPLKILMSSGPDTWIPGWGYELNMNQVIQRKLMTRRYHGKLPAKTYMSFHEPKKMTFATAFTWVGGQSLTWLNKD